jgi:hypothetical protein
MKKIEKVINDLIDIPEDKLLRVINNKNYVKAICDTLKSYGIHYSIENHRILVDLVEERLNGSFEREWTENEFLNFVLYK